jgi:hypothetical protein
MDHQHMEHPTGTAHDGDPAAGHGMLVVGLEAVFFYHLPMFMSPHDYQVILEVALSQPGSDPQRTYKDDRKAFPNTRVYTFDPVPFVLPDVFPPALTLKQIQGDLLRGHFEHPPEYPDKPARIGKGVDASIVTVVFAQKLLPLPVAADHLEYLLFGKGSELFLAHVLTKRGDFDQVVSVEVKGHQFRDDDLRHGVRVQFSSKGNTSAQRLAEGETTSGSARLGEKTVAIEAKPLVELYMSKRDLG